MEPVRTDVRRGNKKETLDYAALREVPLLTLLVDEDTTFGVRNSLAIPFNREPSEEEKSRYNDVEEPFTMVDFDFVLQPTHKVPKPDNSAARTWALTIPQTPR